MVSICKEYYQLFLAQGLLLGIGISLTFCPAIATVSAYFSHNRGLAMGITISGSSLGGVIWPITLHTLFREVGFPWAVRIAGFLMAPLLLTACLTVRLPATSKPPTKANVDFSFALKPAFVLLSFGLFLNYLGLFTPYFYITSYSASIKLDLNTSFYMVSVMNAASLFGRTLPGFLADKYGRFNICILSGLFSAITCFCWTKATTIAGLIIFTIAYGFASGVRPGPLSGVFEAYSGYRQF
jgi:MFS family permease